MAKEKSPEAGAMSERQPIYIDKLILSTMIYNNVSSFSSLMDIDKLILSLSFFATGFSFSSLMDIDKPIPDIFMLIFSCCK